MFWFVRQIKYLYAFLIAVLFLFPGFFARGLTCLGQRLGFSEQVLPGLALRTDLPALF
jgi:hypothetical protein